MKGRAPKGRVVLVARGVLGEAAGHGEGAADAGAKRGAAGRRRVLAAPESIAAQVVHRLVFPTSGQMFALNRRQSNYKR